MSTEENVPEAEEIRPEEEKPAMTAGAMELESLRREASDYKDKYLRLLAEMENTKKRLHKEKHEMTQYGIQNLIVDFLPPIDHMENALKFTEQMSEDVKHWALGFQMILTQFKDALANNGVKPFDSKGSIFDPNCQEAIEMVETEEHPPGIVVEECVRGYKMGDRLIRCARVKVAKKPDNKTN